MRVARRQEESADWEEEERSCLDSRHDNAADKVLQQMKDSQKAVLLEANGGGVGAPVGSLDVKYTEVMTDTRNEGAVGADAERRARAMEEQRNDEHVTQ